jgi:hypothetical protein
MLRRAATRVLIGVVGLIMLACFQAGPGLAQGVSGYSEPTGTLSVGVGAEATGSVNCPAGEVVLDGGYYQPLTFIYITQSAPSNPSGAGWSVSVDNLTGVAVSVSMYAVCSQPPASYSVQTTTCTGGASCTITCPTGTSVTGGGYSYSGSITANGSYPSAPNQWSLTYTSSGGTISFSGSISGEAVCAQAPDGYVQKSGASGTSLGFVNVRCPSGTVVIGGGGDEGRFSQNPGWNAPIAFGPTLESGQWSFGSDYKGAPPATGSAICAQEQPTPTVSGVSPAAGPVAGGTSVVITGTNLTGATAVTLGTAGPATSFTVDSATQITATSPPATAGPVDVTISTAGGTSATGSGDKFTYTAAPTVSVTCTPGAVNLDDSTQCVATVTSPAGSLPPTGNVRFTSDTAGSFGSPGVCTLSGNGGSSSCGLSYTPSAVGSGTHSITATYAGDAVYAAGSASTQVTVAARPTGVGVVCSPSSVEVADATSCTATVTDDGGSGGSAPTGTVTFSSSGQGSFGSGGSCTLSSSGGSTGCAVSYTPSAVGSGTPTISAAYGGDAAHGADSGTTHITVAPSVPTCSPITATSPAGGGATALQLTCAGTGPLSYAITSSPSHGTLGTITAGGQLTYTPTAGYAGTDSFTYQAMSAGGTSAPATVSITIPPPDTTTTSATTTTPVVSHGLESDKVDVACAPAIVAPGHLTRCTATVSDSAFSSAIAPADAFSSTDAAGGRVVFTSGDGRFVGGSSCVLVAVGDGASCWVGFEPGASGTAAVSARYGGDGQHVAAAASTSVASPPVAGSSAAVGVTHGEVYITITTSDGKRDRVPLSPGTVSVPVGATIDARKGVVRIATAGDTLNPRDPHHTVDTGTISNAIFTIEQERARARQDRSAPVPSLVLRTPPGAVEHAACKRSGPPTKGIVRSLTGVVKGIYRTIGAASTTTVRNGSYVVQDRCDGTLTRVVKGRATVVLRHPNRRGRAARTLTAHQNFLAKARFLQAKRMRTGDVLVARLTRAVVLLTPSLWD